MCASLKSNFFSNEMLMLSAWFELVVHEFLEFDGLKQKLFYSQLPEIILNILQNVPTVKNYFYSVYSVNISSPLLWNKNLAEWCRLHIIRSRMKLTDWKSGFEEIYYCKEGKLFSFTNTPVCLLPQFSQDLVSNKRLFILTPSE